MKSLKTWVRSLFPSALASGEKTEPKGPTVKTITQSTTTVIRFSAEEVTDILNKYTIDHGLLPANTKFPPTLYMYYGIYPAHANYAELTYSVAAEPALHKSFFDQEIAPPVGENSSRATSDKEGT